jgi:hypothetical protein
MRNRGLNYALPLEPSGLHPAVVEVFTDYGSFAHVALGVAAAFAPGTYQLAASFAFLGYQVSQVGTGASWPRTGGELLEFALGLVLGHLAQQFGGFHG